MAHPGLTEALAVRLAAPVAARDRQRARLHLLDWVACVRGAAQSPVAQIAQTAEPDTLTRHALLGNVLEMDDIHRTAILHPGPVIWPAAFSAARDKSACLGKTLDAAVRGYEAMITIGRSFDAQHYAHYHPTSTAGIFGAAAATGSLYDFTTEQYVWAFGNAGSITGGLWHMRHDPAAMTKQLHIAHAALAGVWIGRLAAHNFTGPTHILEGAQGVFAAMVKKPALDAFETTANWQIHDVSFKPWAACRHAHPAIDAALMLKQKYGALDGDIIVTTYKDALTFCNRPDPETVLQAKFSLQHAVAIVARRGTPRLADFEPEAIHDAEIITTRARVSVQESAEFTSRYPEHFGAAVRVGDREVKLVDTRGDPERAMSTTELIAKAQDLMDWGKTVNATALIDWILSAPDDAPVSALLEFLP
jgi:2-methylcitrate dehydratase PrpD